MNWILEIKSFSVVFFLWTISASTSVTVNFRNPDRINQQKHQNHNPYEHNVIISTTTTSTTEQPVTVPAAISSSPVVEEESVPSSTSISVPIHNANNRWCNVSVFKKSRVTWLTAYRTCKSLGNGTELASIKTQEDYDTFVSNIKEAGSPASVIYWTSGTDVLDEGVFVWMSDGLEVTRAWWAPGQPDNHWDMEHCIAFKRHMNERSYKMTDENCLLAGAFICVQPCKFWV